MAVFAIFFVSGRGLNVGFFSHIQGVCSGAKLSCPPT